MPEQGSAAHPLLDDEIDLREVTAVIVKRKVLILALFLGAVIAAAGWSVRQPKVYEVAGIVSTGFLDGEVLPSAAAVEMIRSERNIKQLMAVLKVDQPFEGFNFKENISVDGIKGGRSIRVKVRAGDPGMAQGLFETVVEQYFAYGRNIYERKKELYEEKLALINDYKSEMQQDFDKKANVTVGGITFSEPAVNDIFLKNVLLGYQENLIRLKNEELSIKMILDQAQNFKIIEQSDPQQIAPKTGRNMVLAGMLSLMLGMFAAFVAEFFEKGKA